MATTIHSAFLNVFINLFDDKDHLKFPNLLWTNIFGDYSKNNKTEVKKTRDMQKWHFSFSFFFVL